MTESEHTKVSPLGRKPKWQCAWEDRAQRKFEQQTVDAKIWKARQADVHAPDGTRYVVRTVANGEVLRELEGFDAGGSGLGIAFEVASELFQAVRKRRRSGWIIGIVRAESTWHSEKVVFRETVTDEPSIAPRVRELAQAIEDGTIPTN